jgi:exonuclease SbcC
VNKSLIELDKNIAIYKDNLKKLSQDLIIFEKNIDNLIVNNFNNKDLKELFDTIKKIEQEKGNLNYNETEHKQIRENLNLIEQKISLVNKLEDQKLLQVNRRSKITFIYMQLKEFKLLKLKIENDIEKLNLDLSKELLLEKNIIETKNILDSAKIQKEACVQKITVLEHEVNNILKLKKEFENNTVQLNLLTQEMQEYQVLAQAFGKNGIQALLIEQAIPQIEEEANNILSRLTDNQAQIFIESLRDLKSGGVKETLDIKISDSIGIRPYEMFSGGEAFRVDFALRIAISKLLARRAGIALQTLIIDEGFGSQDEDGLSRLMDAIYAIKNDFSKIIVVSHLESFKENFPVHFVVQKNSSGSFVSVYERG